MHATVHRARKKESMKTRGDGFKASVKAVVKHMTAQLVVKIHEIREKVPSLHFPTVPNVLQVVAAGSGNRNCALEFVRNQCPILALDEVCTEKVLMMHNSVLKVLGMR